MSSKLQLLQDRVEAQAPVVDGPTYLFTLGVVQQYIAYGRICDMRNTSNCTVVIYSSSLDWSNLHHVTLYARSMEPTTTMRKLPFQS
jgi:hypothetical protein